MILQLLCQNTQSHRKIHKPKVSIEEITRYTYPYQDWAHHFAFYRVFSRATWRFMESWKISIIQRLSGLETIQENGHGKRRLYKKLPTLLLYCRGYEKTPGQTSQIQ